jgi:hypothetical protein
MAAAQSFEGGCQCGKVRYKVEVALDPVMTCNCSRCQKLGSMLAFTPEDKFQLVQGEDALTEYQFNKHAIHHFFCATCGIQSFSRGAKPDGTKMIAVNVRCLDGVEPDEIKTTKVDGRSF